MTSCIRGRSLITKHLMFLTYPSLNQLWSMRAFLFFVCCNIYFEQQTVLGTWKFQTPLPEGIASTCHKKPPTKFYRYVFMEKRVTSLKLSLCGEVQKWKKKGMRLRNLSLQSEHSLGLKFVQSPYPARHLAVRMPLASEYYCWWLVKSPSETCPIAEVVLPELMPHATLNHPHFTDTYLYIIAIFWLLAKGQGGQNIWDYICVQHDWVDQTSSVQIVQSIIECIGR